MTFEEWWSEARETFLITPQDKDMNKQTWNAAQQAMVEEVIEIARKHTLRPEAFIEELRKRYGVKDE